MLLLLLLLVMMVRGGGGCCYCRRSQFIVEFVVLLCGRCEKIIRTRRERGVNERVVDIDA
jgi:hypothetical protein